MGYYNEVVERMLEDREKELEEVTQRKRLVSLSKEDQIRYNYYIEWVIEDLGIMNEEVEVLFYIGHPGVNGFINLPEAMEKKYTAYINLFDESPRRIFMTIAHEVRHLEQIITGRLEELIEKTNNKRMMWLNIIEKEADDYAVDALERFVITGEMEKTNSL